MLGIEQDPNNTFAQCTFSHVTHIILGKPHAQGLQGLHSLVKLDNELQVSVYSTLVWARPAGFFWEREEPF